MEENPDAEVPLLDLDFLEPTAEELEVEEIPEDTIEEELAGRQCVSRRSGKALS